MPLSDSTANRRGSSALVVFGSLWALWYPGMHQIGWGEPGTTAYQHYEVYNRLLPLILLPLAAALIACRSRLPLSSRHRSRRAIGLTCIGFAVMTAGSFLEFWLFTLAPYASGSLRGVGWITYCAGLLLLFAGTAALGFVLRHSRGLRIGAVLLILPVPSAALVAGLNSLTGLELPPLTLAVAISGAGLASLGYQTALMNGSSSRLQGEVSGDNSLAG